MANNDWFNMDFNSTRLTPNNATAKRGYVQRKSSPAASVVSTVAKDIKEQLPITSLGEGWGIPNIRPNIRPNIILNINPNGRALYVPTAASNLAAPVASDIAPPVAINTPTVVNVPAETFTSLPIPVSESILNTGAATGPSGWSLGGMADSAKGMWNDNKGWLIGTKDAPGVLPVGMNLFNAFNAWNTGREQIKQGREQLGMQKQAFAFNKSMLEEQLAERRQREKDKDAYLATERAKA